MEISTGMGSALYQAVFFSWRGLVKNIGSVLQSQFDKHPRATISDPEADEAIAQVTQQLGHDRRIMREHHAESQPQVECGMDVVLDYGLRV